MPGNILEVHKLVIHTSKGKYKEKDITIFEHQWAKEVALCIVST